MFRPVATLVLMSAIALACGTGGEPTAAERADVPVVLDSVTGDSILAYHPTIDDSIASPDTALLATLIVDTTTRFQQMSGWEATSQAGQDDPAFLGWQMPLANAAINDLGINRMRLEVVSGSENPADNYTNSLAGQVSWSSTRYQMVNDNADPNVMNPAGFHFSHLDTKIDMVVLPLRTAAAARGEHLYVNLNYVSFNSSTAGNVHLASAEYAEFMLAVFTHMQSKYGFVPDAIEVILEPDNHTPWTGTLIGQAVAATGARLAAAGFHPDFIAPSTMSMANAPTYFDQLMQVAAARPFMSEISYHRYAGVSDANLVAIATRGTQWGLRTSMLEHIGSGADDLYKDLTLGNVSAWQQYTLAYPGTNDNGGKYFAVSGSSASLTSRAITLRQYFSRVRSGAWRVGVTVSQGTLPAVAFTNVGGAPVVVLETGAQGTIAVRGLRPGRYGVSKAPTGTQFMESIVGANGVLQITLPAGGLHTIYYLP